MRKVCPQLGICRQRRRVFGVGGESTDIRKGLQKILGTECIGNRKQDGVQTDLFPFASGKADLMFHKQSPSGRGQRARWFAKRKILAGEMGTVQTLLLVAANILVGSIAVDGQTSTFTTASDREPCNG